MEPAWTEDLSEDFIKTGRYFIPEREAQIDTLCALVPPAGRQGLIIDLCCGEGLLAAALLARYPGCRVLALDGSPAMLAHARQVCAAYGERFSAGRIDLFASDWRSPELRPGAILSSLAVHHLDGPGKLQLYRDCHAMLQPGGALLIADLVQPASAAANDYTGQSYDEAIRQRALALDGHTAMYEHFQRSEWNLFRYPDKMDKPSTVLDNLRWLEAAGFEGADVFWLLAGHAIYGGYKAG